MKRITLVGVALLCVLLSWSVEAAHASRWSVEVNPNLKHQSNHLLSFFSSLGLSQSHEPLELNNKLFFILEHPSSTKDDEISSSLQEAINNKNDRLGILSFERLPLIKRFTRSSKPFDRSDKHLSLKQESSSPRESFLPADPLFSFQWHLDNTGQSGGPVGVDVNVVPVWNMGLTGNDVTICVVDDGLQIAHPDISPNYFAPGSWNFKDGINDPTSDEPHGTSAAGVAAGASNNKCGVGAAFSSKISGVQILTIEELTSNIEASALTFDLDHNFIYSNSWGPSDDGKTTERLPLLVSNALDHGINKGRGGLGAIYVWAAGNGNMAKDNSNYDGYANSRLTIAVSACDFDGVQSYYSEPGSNILVTAPSSSSSIGITTTDLLGSDGYDPGDCTSDFGGTSSACPLAAGVIALVIEARPDLTWRDVQHVLVHSCTKNDPQDSGWKKNGAGLWVNHKYGFGLINAEAAVNLSKEWTLVKPSYLIDSGKINVGVSIPDDGTIVEDEVTVTVNGTVEHVEVTFTANHKHPSDLEIVLVSPSGTESILSEMHGFETKGELIGALSSTVSGAMAEFSGPVPEEGLKGSIVLAKPLLGCSDLSSTPNIAGRMVLIQRGECTFAQKALMAQAAKASAMILYDNVPNEKPWSVIGDANVTIPVMMISNSDGLSINTVISKSSSKMIDNCLLRNVTTKSEDETEYTDIKFSTVHNWDEQATGTWTLKVRDLYSDSTSSSKGVWINWRLSTFVITDQPPETNDDLWFYILLGLSIVFGSLLVIVAVGYAIFVALSRFRRSRSNFQIVDQDFAGPDDFTIESE